MKHILGKIEIVVCIGSANIVIHLISAVCDLLEFGDDDIVASLSAAERTHTVVYFLTSVDGKDDISHLFVGEL